jgi:hypothetical protein
MKLHQTIGIIVALYRVFHSGLASEDLCGRALGRTLHPRKQTFPIIITSKVFFQLVCVYGKIEICEEKRKMMLSFNVQFNGSAINLLVSRDEATFGQAISNELVAVLGPDAIGYSTVTSYLRQRHFPSTLRGTPDEPLHGIHWDFA